jgi:protocatechuate 3,4-dioxygenase beta subunit
MNRRKLLKGVGTLGLASMLPIPSLARQLVDPLQGARQVVRPDIAACWLTPASTEGPYYFDPGQLRTDIRTDTASSTVHDGIPLHMTLRVVNLDCNPIPGLLVDVWHADVEGLYSGYVQPHGSTVGEDFLRGTQVTDALGECRFVTSYPGWYPGRAPHIHFKVRLSSMAYVTSQFAFDDAVNAEVYGTALYAARGQNPTTNATDGVFRDASPEHLLMEVTEDAASGGYSGSFTIGIDSPTDAEDAPDASGYWLGQNYPNPVAGATTIPYTLPVTGPVELTVFDAAGRERARLVDTRQQAGRHDIPFAPGDLPSGYYFFRLKSGDAVRMREMLLIRQ